MWITKASIGSNSLKSYNDWCDDYYWLSWIMTYLLLIIGEYFIKCNGQTSIISIEKQYFNLHCTSSHKYNSLLHAIDDVEDLQLDVPINMALDYGYRKRFILNLNQSVPLIINFSQILAKKLYFNQKTILMTILKGDPYKITLPCALRGQYDLFIQARDQGSIRISAHIANLQDSWPLLNHSNIHNVNSQNRVRKRQMFVKWNKSKFDFHAMHYCLVINTKRAYFNFCEAIEDYVSDSLGNSKDTCLTLDIINFIYNRKPGKTRKIDPNRTNVICTGSYTQQLLRGLAINNVYYLNVFGVHTKKQNLTFHLASTSVYFNRSHPLILKPNILNIVKITGLNGLQVFSFKIPASLTLTSSKLPIRTLRYLVLPCAASEIDVSILKQRILISREHNIYKPTYIKVANVTENERYLIRFKASNDDEVLKANKLGLAVTTDSLFKHLPELPENTTVFQIRTLCTSIKIAWYNTPDIRPVSYCIIVLNLSQRARNLQLDYTNYCLDFSRRIMQHPQFHSFKCPKRINYKSNSFETDTIYNLRPGESYLIYVTANLSEGRPLAYQSLKVQMYEECHDD